MQPTLSHSLLTELSEFVAARLGLNFPEERWHDLQRGAECAARELGFGDGPSFAQWLLSSNPERRHLEILASHLTVGETYFFRERESLDVFETRIVPELVRSRAAGERHSVPLVTRASQARPYRHLQPAPCLRSTICMRKSSSMRRLGCSQGCPDCLTGGSD